MEKTHQPSKLLQALIVPSQHLIPQSTTCTTIPQRSHLSPSRFPTKVTMTTIYSLHISIPRKMLEHS